MSQTKKDLPDMRVKVLEELQRTGLVDEDDGDVVMVGEFDCRGLAVTTDPKRGDLTLVVVEIGQDPRSIYLPAEAANLVRAALSLSEKGRGK